MSPHLLPAVDPLGLPGPIWLLQLLLVLTFFLHLLFMNLTLGGTLLAAISHALARGRSEGTHAELSRRLVAINTFGISLTITTGVAPLLFLQVLYQQLFYAATILLGWIWFALILLLMTGYYAHYLHKLGNTARSLWLWLAASAFLLVGVIQVLAHLAQVQPAMWGGLAAAPWSLAADPTFGPRLLHFVLAGVATSAALVAWWAVRRGRDRGGRGIDADVARLAWKWALWTTLLQVVDGILLLVVLPSTVLLALMRGGAATMAPLTVAVLLGVGLLVMLARLDDPGHRPGTVAGVLATMIVTMAVMAVTRHQVRDLYVADLVAFGSFPVAVQWLNIALFAVLLVAALATVALMVRKVLASPASGAKAA